MKALIICALLCLAGCSAAPDSKDDTFGSETSNSTGGYDYPGTGDRGGCGAYRVISVWKDGERVPQLQPVLCNQGIQIFKGDPGPDRGDPNPWDFSPEFKKSEQVVNVSAE